MSLHWTTDTDQGNHKLIHNFVQLAAKAESDSTSSRNLYHLYPFPCSLCRVLSFPPTHRALQSSRIFVSVD